MSASIDQDQDPADEGEDARSVLASWLDDYTAGRCDRADMQESFLCVCRGDPDAPWDALALLDQYQRRGRIDMELMRSLKAEIAQLVFGASNQTELPREAPRETPQPTVDTPSQPADETRTDRTASRWRKLTAERDSQTLDSEPVFADPTLFRPDFDPATRPPPALNLQEEPAAPRALPSSDVLRDRYELLSILGRGSTGTVYKALDRRRAHLPSSARCVAVKVLKLKYGERPQALAELEREFHQAQSLSHPNIVSVFDLDRDGDTYFLVMELLEGDLLADVLRRLDRRPMLREHALGIIGSVGAALAHAHRRDVVHGDLKPRNIMITSDGELRVLDFGFARSRQLDLHSASPLYGAAAPAPAYASVERANGSEPLPSDDVYSLACIAYELLSGQHPFGGRSGVLARAHGRGPRRIPGLSRKQSQALNRALLWTRGERRIDVQQLLDALECTDAPNRLVPPDLLVIPDVRSFWRRRVAAMAVFVALAVAGAAFLYQQPIPPPIFHAAAPATAPAPVEPSPINAAPIASSGVPESTAVADGPDASDASDTSDSAAAPPLAPPEQPQTEHIEPQPIAKADVPTAAASRPSTSRPAGPATIQLDKDTYVATESDGSVRVRVHRGGSTAQAVSFRWHLRGNSAEQGTDYADFGPAVEQIAAGASQAIITIPLVSDAMVENTEVFLVEIEPAEERVSLGERAHAAVIIVDDD